MTKTPFKFAILLPKIRTGLFTAFGRFPWMLLCGLIGTVFAILIVHEDQSDDFSHLCERILMTVALGMPLFFSLRMLRERSANLVRWPVELLGLPLLAGWYFSLPANPMEGPGIVWIRWALLLGALHFFAAVAAYVRGAESGAFWQFNRRIFLRFSLATLYAGVLTAGLEVALLSADKLFELKLDKSYAYLFFVMAGCFHPVFFLAGVPRDFAALEIDNAHPRGLKAFTQFVLAPLVAVYTLILYIYAGKILVAREWPHGWVALPVLVLSGVGILAALLLHPLRERTEEKWAGWYCRWFPRALAPLSLLLLLSIRERVMTYGVTEERYLGLVAGGWILIWALLFILRKYMGIRWIPASLAVICLLAAFGPMSAGAISKSSQLRRLQNALAAHGYLASGHILVPFETLELPAKEYRDISSTLRYLIEKHGGQSLHDLFGGVLKIANWDKLTNQSVAPDILNKLHLKAGQGAENDDNSYFTSVIDAETSISLEGFRKVWFLENLGYSSWKSKKQIGNLYIGMNQGVLAYGDTELAKPQPIPLDTFLASLPNERTPNLPVEKMTTDWTHNGRNFRLVFTQIYYERKNSGQKHINSCSLMVLEK